MFAFMAGNENSAEVEIEKFLWECSNVTLGFVLVSRYEKCFTQRYRQTNPQSWFRISSEILFVSCFSWFLPPFIKHFYFVFLSFANVFLISFHITFCCRCFDYETQIMINLPLPKSSSTFSPFVMQLKNLHTTVTRRTRSNRYGRARQPHWRVGSVPAGARGEGARKAGKAAERPWRLPNANRYQIIPITNKS